MTLRQFLAATAAADDTDVRRALAHALGDDVPVSRSGYARMYRRVTAMLSATPGRRAA